MFRAKCITIVMAETFAVISALTPLITWMRITHENVINRTRSTWCRCDRTVGIGIVSRSGSILVAGALTAP